MEEKKKLQQLYICKIQGNHNNNKKLKNDKVGYKKTKPFSFSFYLYHFFLFLLVKNPVNFLCHGEGPSKLLYYRKNTRNIIF